MTVITINIVLFEDQPPYETISDAIRTVHREISLRSDHINKYSKLEFGHGELGVYNYELSINKIPDARKPE